ncbi:MAG: hypothetical protein ACYDIA_05750 [Candidatus Humimicrobiaceae bacterium]
MSQRIIVKIMIKASEIIARKPIRDSVPLEIKLSKKYLDFSLNVFFGLIPSGDMSITCLFLFT